MICNFITNWHIGWSKQKMKLTPADIKLFHFLREREKNITNNRINEQPETS